MQISQMYSKFGRFLKPNDFKARLEMLLLLVDEQENGSTSAIKLPPRLGIFPVKGRPHATEEQKLEVERFMRQLFRNDHSIKISKVVNSAKEFFNRKFGHEYSTTFYYYIVAKVKRRS